MPVTLNFGGDIGDKYQISDLPLCVDVPLIRQRFSLLHLVDYFIDLCPL
jgi:hypothetical protein